MSDLLKINVNGHTEKKNGLTYLSWAWAWAEVLKVDPEATWHAHEYDNPAGVLLPCMFLPDGTAMVKTEVAIQGRVRTCMLPVMDHRNKAIKNPDAFAINTAIMRCMTKAISMHGLGLYIYAGEDLPEGGPEKAQPEPEPVPDDGITAARRAELDQMAGYIVECCQGGKELDAIRCYYDPQSWSEDNPTATEEHMYVWRKLGKTHSAIRSLIKRNHPDRLKEAA